MRDFIYMLYVFFYINGLKILRFLKRVECDINFLRDMTFCLFF